MQSEVCGSLGEQLSSNKKSNQWPKSPKSGNSVCVVQKKEDKGNESSIKKRTNTSILWEVLFGKVADYSTMGKREFTQSDKNSAKVQNREKISTNIDINEKEKQGSKVQEEITNRIFKMEKEKSDISPSWWKWFYNSTPKNIVKINRNEDGISDKNQTRSWGISLIANSLQSRLSQYWKKSSGGSRWKFPLIKKVEVLGQKKDKSTQISRVVSVEVLEQGSNGRSSKNSRQDSFVYNIEVEGNHNYFANGVLVANCKSIKAIRTKAFRAISRNIHSVVLLSGTPLLSRPSELFSLLNIIDPKTWNNWYDFARKYCNMRQTRWGVDTSGASNTEELHARIKRYFIRREKSEVLKELPPKNFIDVPIELTGDSLTEYSEAAKDLAFYLRRYVGKQPPEIAKALAAEKLTQLNVLRQLCALGKIDTAIELIENIVDSGEKVLVFSSFVEPLARLQAHFGSKSVLLTGQTPVADRQGIVESFQGDKNVQVFLGGYKSAGIGLTLTAASNFLGLDYPWNPADLSQSIDRLHRPGQKAESVNVYQITAKDTIDEDMKETLDRKQNIFDQVIDGKVEDKVASETMEKAVDRVLKNY